MANRNEPDVTSILIVLILFMTVCAIGLVSAIISAIGELIK
jgi:hypothetical protein